MIPPGSTVSCPAAMKRLLGVTVTVALAPTVSVPDDGTTASSPSRLCDSEMDHLTGPFEAVRVRVTERPGRGAIDWGSTVRVPWTGGGMAVPLVEDRADGRGEPRPDADLLAEGREPAAERPPAEPPGAGPTAGGRPPPTVTVTVTEGDACPALVGRADPLTPGPRADTLWPAVGTGL